MLLKNCKILKELTEGYDGSICDVLIEESKIEGIYECGNCTKNEEQILDLNGKYLLPGFFDLHVHLSLSGGNYYDDKGKSPARRAYDAEKHARDTLMAGFTTIRDAGGAHNIAIELRRQVTKGNIIGPNITGCGKLLEVAISEYDFLSDCTFAAPTLDDLGRGIREQINEGADFIKAIGTQSVRNSNEKHIKRTFTLEEYKTMVQMAEFADCYVAVHCGMAENAKDCIRAGVRTIEHALNIDDEAIELLKQSTSTYLVPTLQVMRQFLGMSPDMEEAVMNAANSLRKAYDAGLLLGFGTDTGGVGMLHGKNGEEFIARKELCGIAEIDIIKQATINSAIIIGREKEYGTIKAGKYADLVVVDGNPLEDISVLKNNIIHVIKSGRLVK